MNILLCLYIFDILIIYFLLFLTYKKHSLSFLLLRRAFIFIFLPFEFLSPDGIELVWYICSNNLLEDSYLIVIPYYANSTETIVVIAITIVTISIENSRFRVRIVIVTTTFEHRIMIAVVQTNKVRVVQFYSNGCNSTAHFALASLEL